MENEYIVIKEKRGYTRRCSPLFIFKHLLNFKYLKMFS